MTLYEINEELRSAIENISYDEETGEIDINSVQAVEELEIERNAKLEAYAIVFKELNAEIEDLKEEKKNIETRAKTKLNKAEYLKNVLLNELDGETLETSKVKISYRKSTKLEIEDEDDIPKEYLRLKYEVDKSKIKEQLKQGIEIEGCRLVDTNNIQIK